MASQTVQTLQYIELYKQEVTELLVEVEDTTLALEKNPRDVEAIHQLFRHMHTIKGSGAMFGFENIAQFVHHVETVLDKIREKNSAVSKELIDLILASCDQIKLMLEAGVDPPENESNLAIRQTIINSLQAYFPTENAQKSKSSQEDSKEEKKQMIYRIRFQPSSEILKTGMNPCLLLEDIKELGECVIVAQTEGIPNLENLDPEACYLFWDIILTTNQGKEAIQEVFIFVEEQSKISIKEIRQDTEDDGQFLPRLGEILVERGDVSLEELDSILNRQKKLGELLVESKVVSSDKIQSALKEQKVLNNLTKTSKFASIRVPSEKLDRLINLVGELVINQARLAQVSGSVDNQELATPVEEIGRLTGELRDCVLNIRMVPIGSTFAKFRRVLRDLAVKLNKKIELVTEGAETELDKNVIERLEDPLVHMIRNSVDHGVESPEERERTGKNPTGMIRLAAAHQGANVVITIEDDGAGLDPEIIKAKAIEKGLIDSDTNLASEDVFKLIFHPGFSTAKKVTDLSGRGVGMDVVKREIDALQGNIKVRSKKGMGTTFSISLPLTLAIIEGLLVQVGDSQFVLPMAMVEECVELQKESAKNNGRNMIPVRGELIPYITLRKIFGIEGPRPDIEEITIVRVNDLRVGIVVDKIIGNHQTVIKSLSKICRDAEGISAATIMGDGNVALIIDIPGLIHCAQKEEKRECMSDR